MRLTLLGGGGFRVPLVHAALLADHRPPRVDELVLHDVDPGRLTAVAHVLSQQAAGHPDAPMLRSTTDLDEALRGADVVFSAIRVGGLTGRTTDERVALEAGLLGQETTGPGGIAYGLRTVPVAVHVAERVAALAPSAWVINFSNPAGLVTEAMAQVLGSRVVGICDSPAALVRRSARALGVAAEHSTPDYAGLNHLGWLRGLSVGGRDVLPELLADDAALATVEEARLFGPGWVRGLGALPNEYLYYYYCTREAVAGIRGGPDTRGQFLLRQQSAFYAAVARDPGSALALWRRAREERESTYMSESRAEDDPGRDAADLAGGGYEGVALALMAAIARDERATMVLDVPNATTLAGLPTDAVVEVTCMVDANGPHPLATPPLTGHMLGLVAQVKEVEQLTIRAARTGSAATALRAFALHPLVDSLATARVLLDGYRSAVPGLADQLR